MTNLLITLRQQKNQHGKYVDVLESAYVRYFSEFGVNVIPLPNAVLDVQSFLSKLCIAGVILSGGEDIDFSFKEGMTAEPFAPREKIETNLLDYAIEKKMPVLGICRGMQFIYFYFTGKTCRRIKNESMVSRHVPARNHAVRALNNRMKRDLRKDEFTVNSFHNWFVHVEDVAEPVRACVMAKDDPVVEGVYVKGYPIAGFQWHPERDGSDSELDRYLIQAFLNQELFWKAEH